MFFVCLYLLGCVSEITQIEERDERRRKEHDCVLFPLYPNQRGRILKLLYIEFLLTQCHFFFLSSLIFLFLERETAPIWNVYHLSALSFLMKGFSLSLYNTYSQKFGLAGNLELKVQLFPTCNLEPNIPKYLLGWN